MKNNARREDFPEDFPERHSNLTLSSAEASYSRAGWKRAEAGKREKLKRAGNAEKEKERKALPIVPRAPVFSLQRSRFPLFSFTGVN